MMNYRHIEGIVCDSVNYVVAELRKGNGVLAAPSDLYGGTTKVALSIAISRQFCYWVFHDLYHIAYSTISEHSGMSQRSVIGGVRKVRDMVFIDSLYASVADRIKEKL